MPEKQLDFYFDFTSPASYLAWTQIEDIAERAGASINWKPIFLGALFKETGGQGNIAVQNKFNYTKLDMKRCADHLGAPFVFPPEFPVLAVGSITPEKIGPYWAAGARGFGLGGSLYKPGDDAKTVAGRVARFR